MNESIERLVPSADGPLSDDDLLEAYAAPTTPWLRVNFIASVDGASTREGHSGALGDAADRRVFDLLRRLADVVLVGAATIRNEGYGGFRLSPDDVSWRLSQGFAAHPTLAIVSGSLNLNPASDVFSNAPVRPVIYTVDCADAEQRAKLASVADVVGVGGSTLDPIALRDDLIARRLSRMHCEGGPMLLGSLIEADVVDELCLTVAPTLEAGEAGRIAHSMHAAPVPLRLATVLRAQDELFLRYVRR